MNHIDPGKPHVKWREWYLNCTSALTRKRIRENKHPHLLPNGRIRPDKPDSK